jgi:hypothetical protein
MLADTGDSSLRLWDWFAHNVAKVATAYGSGDYAWLDRHLLPLVKAIDEQMNWEIGPYALPDDTFVLSPTVRENLPKARAAVAAAPKVPGWVFLPAKPPKVLDTLAFTIDDSKVNADEWRYRMTSYNKGEFVDIEIFLDRTTAPLAGTENTFCELVVEALLGEELRLDRVGYLKPILVGDVMAVEKASQMKYLRKHLAQVLAPIH